MKLVDHYYRETGTPLAALSKAMIAIRGSYALAVMFNDYPDQIWTARKDSPMIIGVEKGESFIASDVPAILKRTRNVYYVGNMEISCVKAGEAEFFNIDGERLEKTPVTITWDAEAAEKGGYEHFMIKEIHEQPKAISDTLSSLIRDGHIDLSASGLDDELLKKIRSITIAACGSAWHVGIEAQYVIESLARIPVRVELASEFRYRDPIIGEDDLVIIISQSGETADSLAALREATSKGAHTLAIVKVLGSSIAREAEFVL